MPSAWLPIITTRTVNPLPQHSLAQKEVHCKTQIINVELQTEMIQKKTVGTTSGLTEGHPYLLLYRLQRFIGEHKWEMQSPHGAQ